MLDAELITKSQLEQATWNCHKNNLSLGRNLVLTGAITPSILGSALNVLILVRQRSTTLENGAAALITALRKKISVEEVLGLPASDAPNHVRLGELLSLAGIITEGDAMSAAERSLLEQKEIGSILIEKQMITVLELEAALKLQALIDNQFFTRTQSIELLRQVHEKSVPIDAFISEMSAIKRRALDLLLSTGLVLESDVVVAVQEFPHYQSDVTRALLACKMLTDDQFKTALRCVFGMDNGLLSEQDAISQVRQASPPPQDANEQVMQSA